MRTFADELADLLQEHGWDQGDLASAVGVSQTMVSKWLRGSIPRPATMRRIEQAFNLDDGTLNRQYGTYIPEPPPPSDLADAIMREPRLSRRAREQLLAYFQGLLDASDRSRRR